MAMREMTNRSCDRDTWFMMSGAALVLIGTSLLLSNPTVRRYLRRTGLGDLVSSAVPDVDRDLRPRAM